MKTSEVFEGAADAIETYGHNRRDLGNKREGFCAIGALSFVTSSNDNHLDDYRNYRDALVRLRDLKEDMGVAPWSDNAPTQEVLDTLRKAAKEARLEEEGIR